MTLPSNLPRGVLNDIGAEVEHTTCVWSYADKGAFEGVEDKG